MALTIILLSILFICVAMLWNEGMWSNALSVMNVTLAGLVATNSWEMLADNLNEKAPSFTYLLDFVSLWFVFCLTYGILRAVTDQISKHKIKFKMPIEQAGRAIFALWTGWVMVCFTTFTLHTAPLAKDCLRGSFKYNVGEQNFLGLGPDVLWLGFVQSLSKGALSRADAQGQDGVRVFDPGSNFRGRYAERRAKLEPEKGMRVGVQ